MPTGEAEMASDPPSPPLSLLGSCSSACCHDGSRALKPDPRARRLQPRHPEEYAASDEAREMTCRHRFHSDCIEKWLSTHGTCPVCRFTMPPEADAKVPGEGGEDRGRSQRSIVLNLVINGRDASITGSGHGSTGHERSPGSDDSGSVAPAQDTDS